MSTRDRMLAKAGLGGGALEAADWPVGVVGVPGDGRCDGLAAGREVRTERKIKSIAKEGISQGIIRFVVIFLTVYQIP